MCAAHVQRPPLCLHQDVVRPPVWNVDAPVLGPSVRMSRFEHVDGCRVCEGLYKHYTYPNGKTVHFFHKDTLHELLVDTSVQLPDPPMTLESIFQTDFPEVDMLGTPRGGDISVVGDGRGVYRAPDSGQPQPARHGP